MKFFLISGILFLSFSFFELYSNPFVPKLSLSAEKDPLQEAKKIEKKKTKTPIYQGYAMIGKKYIAFLNLSGRQYSLQKGDFLGKLVVIEISPSFVILKDKNRVVKIPLKMFQK